jgi:NAD(P)-dependent dehydrogenase (short-subunit alcohol dehydrogenase family)
MANEARVALVTGASRGIGRAVAMRMAADGDRVAVHYNTNREAAEATSGALEGSGHHIFAADVASAAACEGLIADVVATMGGLDVLVNNAGIYRLHAALDIDFDGWREAWAKTIDTNLLGPAHLMYHGARHMAAHGGGRIVNVSSRGAFRGEPEMPAYGAAKAGLNSLSQSMAKYLAPHGIFVGVVAPGFVETDMAAPYLEGEIGREIRSQSPLNRAARPDEIARAVQFLASEGIDYLTGCIIDANGASYLRT